MDPLGLGCQRQNVAGWGWGVVVGRPGDAQNEQGCLPKRREKPGVGCGWVAAGDGLGIPGECGSREEEWGNQMPPLQDPATLATLAISSFSVGPRYITLYPYPREATWAQPSALAGMLPQEGGIISNQFPPVSNLIST